MERHQVPVEYLANPELAQALKTAHSAKTPTAVEAADAAVKKRMFLIRIVGLGREIEHRVTGNDSSRLKDQGLKAESTSAADYGSAERR